MYKSAGKKKPAGRPEQRTRLGAPKTTTQKGSASRQDLGSQVDVEGLNPIVSSRIMRKLKFSSVSMTTQTSVQGPERREKAVRFESPSTKSLKKQPKGTPQRKVEVPDPKPSPLDNLREEIAAANLELQSLNADRPAPRGEVEVRVSALQTENTANLQALSDARRQCSELELRRGEFAAEYERMKEELERLKGRAPSDERKSDADALEEENLYLRSIFLRLEGDAKSKANTDNYHRVLSQHQDTLRLHIANLRAENGRLRQEKSQLDARYGVNDDSLRGLEQDQVALIEENRRLREELEQCRRELNARASASVEPSPVRVPNAQTIDLWPLAHAVDTLKSNLFALVASNNRLNDVLQRLPV